MAGSFPPARGNSTYFIIYEYLKNGNILHEHLIFFRLSAYAPIPAKDGIRDDAEALREGPAAETERRQDGFNALWAARERGDVMKNVIALF